MYKLLNRKHYYQIIKRKEWQIVRNKRQTKIKEYEKVFGKFPAAVAHHKVIYDKNNKAVDYIFLKANKQFEEMTGLKITEIINKKVSQVLKGIKKSKFNWIEFYGQIALSGEEKSFEQYSEPLDRWYEVTVFSHKKGYFTTIFYEISERKRKEKALEDKQEKLELLLDTIDTQVWYLKDEVTYGRLNQAHADFMGVEKEVLKNQKLSNFLTPAEVESCRKSNQKVFKEKEKLITEEWVYSGQKEKRLLSITKNPRLNEAGEVEYVVCSADDITDNRRKDQKLSHALSFSKMGFWEYDIATTALKWSPECEQIFGLKPGEFEGRFEDFLKRVAPEDRVYVRRMNSPIIDMKKGIPLEYEHRIIKKNGEKCWVKESANLNDDNKIIGLVINITEQKNIEAELKTNREKLEHLISETTAVIYSYQVIANSHKILYINKNVKNVLGFSADEFIDNEEFHLNCVHPDDREIVKAKMMNVKKTDSSVDEYRFKDKEGKYHWLYDQQKVSRRENGVITVVGSWWDVTEQRREQKEEVSNLLDKDNLTGLYNRRYFKNIMTNFDLKNSLPTSMIIADINGLKIVNDSYGFEKGDQLLKQTANILEDIIREKDLLARWGGDEFIILLPGCNMAQALNIISSLKSHFAESKKLDLPISISFGAATAEKKSDQLSEVLKVAEKNMDQNKLLESSSAKSKIVENILSTLGAKSNETKEHALRMSKLAGELGKRVGLSNYDLNRLSLLARLHDIGKTTISEAILTKPGRLSNEEWQIMQGHPQKGFEIASASAEFAVIAEEILSHHEHWDGNGYPRGLKGKEIPLLARIISIIDAYDVITNDRPYTSAQPPEKALAEIKRCAGSQFDPHLAQEFLQMMEGK
ncbi:PAS domain-containing protein [Halanaerobium hydrogeniformans]|uniref:Diguanylate cyclase and metal dependent phosphohydrolase n=1 Tax=Halanaerobium hydrogeniformans TaxID=656519 RepID=E4RNZ1_HALHG|nr:PAS domain-containing protein [Halanaerobium hydrogeniformans]ADQ13681.1 diguanylate cyclase and metal dependent phosphohydrolase [Halanaerobium hydrogeniformans]